MARTVSEIEIDLTNARAALTSAMSAQSYSLDTGQGKQSVTRANLKEIRSLIKDLEQELEDATEPGILAGNFDRGAC